MDAEQKDKSDTQKRKGDKKEICPTGHKKKKEFEEGGNLFACPRFPTHCAQSSQSGKHAALPSCQRSSNVNLERALNFHTSYIYRVNSLLEYPLLEYTHFDLEDVWTTDFWTGWTFGLLGHLVIDEYDVIA